jgi:hypothetical protein
MTARKPANQRKTTTARAAADEPTTASATDEQRGQNDGQEPELAWCRIGRDLEETAPECPRHEFEPGARLCNLHFVTRLDLREVARNVG